VGPFRLAASTALVLVLAACGESQATPAPSAHPAAPPATSHAAPRRAAADPGPARPLVGDPAHTAALTRVWIATAVDDGPAEAGPIRARAGQRVTLFAVLEAGAATYSDAPRLRRGRAIVSPRPLAAAPGAELRWAKVEPEAANLSNTTSGSFRFEAIPYRAVDLPAAAGHGHVAADVHPTLTPDHGHGLGTMRFQLEARQGERVVRSPGADSRRGRGAGGLSADVHRVSIRRDDTFLGYLTEMYGQPYIWASAGTSPNNHQSEHLEGSDCADLMVYGARRAGLRLPYSWTGDLPRVTRLLGRGEHGDDGVYRDRRGQPVPFTPPGRPGAVPAPRRRAGRGSGPARAARHR
jgi:hypothetical protein